MSQRQLTLSFLKMATIGPLLVLFWPNSESPGFIWLFSNIFISGLFYSQINHWLGKEEMVQRRDDMGMRFRLQKECLSRLFRKLFYHSAWKAKFVTKVLKICCSNYWATNVALLTRCAFDNQDRAGLVDVLGSARTSPSTHRIRYFYFSVTHMWCDQAKWVGTRYYWFWDIANNSIQFSFLLLFWASLKWLYLWNCMLSFYGVFSVI